MVRLSLVSLLVLCPTLKAEQLRSPAQWAMELGPKLESRTPKMMRYLMLVSTDPKKQRAWEDLLKGLGSLGWLQHYSSQNLHYFRFLNETAVKNLSDVALATKYFPVEVYLEDAGKEIQVYFPGSEGLSSYAKWPISNTDSATSADFLEWLRKRLGYEAFVLDVDKNLVLAALIQSKRGSGQAILVKDSASYYSLAGVQVKGEALLNIRRVEGSLAIMEVLVNKKSGPIEPGSKLLLGK